MTTKRWDGATFTNVAAIKRWDGAAWVAITIYKRWDGAAWQNITIPGGAGGGLSATASPGSSSGSVFDPEPAPLFKAVNGNIITVTPAGGTGPYTYAWSRVSGDSAINASSPAGAATGFEATVGKNQEKSAMFRCTVTDSLLAVTSVDVPVTMTYTTDI